jgi:hypothetical protein
MKLTLAALVLLSVPALAEEKPFNIDDLSIAGVGYSGRAAIEQFYGRPLAVEDGRWEGVFHFDAGGRVSWTKPSGETLRGHFGDGAAHPSMCLDFSYDDSDCFDVQQAGDDLHFSNGSTGSFSGRAEPGQAEDALPEPEQDFCGPLDEFLKAGRAKNLDSLIDQSRDPIEVNPLRGPSYWTVTQWGEDKCQFLDIGGWKSINCDFIFEDDAPKAEELFERIVGLSHACHPREVEASKRDMTTWLRYEELDFSKMSTRKKAKEAYQPSKDDALRRSTIQFTGGVELNVELGYRSICSSLVDCAYRYGTWVRIEGAR